jgi:hypothetical protein
MTNFFSRLRGRDGKKSKRGDANDAADMPKVKRWDDASTRTSVDPEEVQELIKRCTEELKSRGTCHKFLPSISGNGMPYL